MTYFIKTTIAIIRSLLLVAATSCTVVGTLNPVYTNPKEFIIKKDLVGKWIDTKDKNGYLIIDTLVKDYPQSYNLYMVSNGGDEPSDTTHFVGHLVNNGGTYFLECWYDIGDDKIDLVIPRYFIAKISFIDKDNIEFSFPDAERLIKLIDEKKLRLNYAEKVKGETENGVSYLIINKSPALRIAITEMKKYPDLFKDKNTLIRSE